MKIVTYTGRLIDVKNPKPDDINLIDIARGLSRQFRFNGLTKHYHLYTVAQHSIIVSKLCLNPKSMLLAMLHDASEAYLHDIPTPIKLHLPDYQLIEARWQEAILEALMPADLFDTVSEADACEEECKSCDRLALVHEVNTIVMHPEAYAGIEKIPEIAQIHELRVGNVLCIEDAALQYIKTFDAIIKALKKK